MFALLFHDPDLIPKRFEQSYQRGKLTIAPVERAANIHSDFIKIDGSIIRQCCESDESERLVALIAGWKDISSREVSIVAEYVENTGIQEKMTRFGIDYSQGYLFSKPSPEVEIVKKN